MELGEELYRRSPVWAQNVLLNAYALRLHWRRYRSPFPELFERWDESQWWDPERLRKWQDRRLRAIVTHAYETVPFYRDRLDDEGFRHGDVEGVEDLQHLPVLTKAEVRAAGADLVSREAERGALDHGHTSGTTGSPLGLWYDRQMSVVNAVADWRQKAWGGMERGDWCGVFLGRVVVPTDWTAPPFWRVNRVHRQVWYSSFHLSESNLPRYVEDIRRRGLRFLEGYPSTLYILASHLLRAGRRLPMEAVFTSSETLHRIQREAIEEAFECPIFDFYGLAERVIFAGECERHEGKHLFDEYGVTEVVDDEGNPVAEGERGWLVGTTLWNRAMPLLRYRTSDLSARIEGRCECGRGLGRIESVTTKAEDIVVTPDGRLVSPSVLTHPFKPFESIRKSQIVQEEPDSVLVKIVAGEEFTSDDQRRLVGSLAERLGGTVEIEVRRVDEIPPEPSGKFRWVISKVSHMADVSWDPRETSSASPDPS